MKFTRDLGAISLIAHLALHHVGYSPAVSFVTCCAQENILQRKHWISDTFVIQSCAEARLTVGMSEVANNQKSFCNRNHCDLFITK